MWRRFHRGSRLPCSPARASQAGLHTSSSRSEPDASSDGRPAMSDRPSAVSTDLASYRDRFPILEQTTYLINPSLGAMPAAAEERLQEYARTWREAAFAHGRKGGGKCRSRSATRSVASSA